MKIGSRTCALLAASFPMCIAGAAHAEGRFYGMLRSRDLTPFGFLRLDMRPAHAISIETGTFAIEAELGYQNTWALAANVERYLNGLEDPGRGATSGRRRSRRSAICPARTTCSTSSPRRSISTCTTRSRASGARTRSRPPCRTTADSWTPGIEKFHDDAGFQHVRPARAGAQRTNLIYDLKGSQVVMLDAPQTSGFMDPTFGLRYAGIKLPGRWQMSMEAAVKVPLAGRAAAAVDGPHGLRCAGVVRRLGARRTRCTSTSPPCTTRAKTIPSPHESQIVPTIVIGWERKLTTRTNVNLQGYASRASTGARRPISTSCSTTSIQLSLGCGTGSTAASASFAMTENLQNLNNTPDIGFQVGFALGAALIKSAVDQTGGAVAVLIDVRLRRSVLGRSRAAPRGTDRSPARASPSR